MSFAPGETPRVAAELEGKHPREVLAFALEHHPDALLAFSGAEEVALIDMARDLGARIVALFIDTGRLHPETYRFVEKVRAHYRIEIEVLFPQAERVRALVEKKGFFSFYQEGHQECCGVRKVGPLKAKLATVGGWITGQRRDQSPATRARVPMVEEDLAFSASGHRVVKFNPLAAWTSADVWAYIRENDVPFNELHQRGFVSIGCEPCTRAVLPGQHERSGRWWWEDATQKECGLHLKATPPK